MKIDEIKLLFDYSDWADQRIFAACARVSSEQYTAVTGCGCLSATLVHIVDGMLQWRLVFQGVYRSTLELGETDLPTLAAVEKRWREERAELRAFIDPLTNADLNGILRYPISDTVTRERVLWHCLVHLVNHGTQHRSEAAALLTSFGQSPGDLDFTLFLNERYHLPS